jgi:hypothetical protein
MHKKEERGWSGYKGGWSDFRPSIFKTYRKQLLNNHHLAGLLIYPIDFEDAQFHLTFRLLSLPHTATGKSSEKGGAKNVKKTI